MPENNSSKEKKGEDLTERRSKLCFPLLGWLPIHWQWAVVYLICNTSVLFKCISTRKHSHIHYVVGQEHQHVHHLVLDSNPASNSWESAAHPAHLPHSGIPAPTLAVPMILFSFLARSEGDESSSGFKPSRQFLYNLEA